MYWFSFFLATLPFFREHFDYPFVFDITTQFVYKYIQDRDTFDFYGVMNEEKQISQDLNPYLLKLLEIVNLKGIPCNDTNFLRPYTSILLPEIEEKDEDKFTLSHRAKARFYKLKKDNCSICFETKILYYSGKCAIPHPYCKNCWVKTDKRLVQHVEKCCIRSKLNTSIIYNNLVIYFL
jgi:hypothetical protein